MHIYLVELCMYFFNIPPANYLKLIYPTGSDKHSISNEQIAYTSEVSYVSYPISQSKGRTGSYFNGCIIKRYHTSIVPNCELCGIQRILSIIKRYLPSLYQIFSHKKQSSKLVLDPWVLCSSSTCLYHNISIQILAFLYIITLSCHCPKLKPSNENRSWT